MTGLEVFMRIGYARCSSIDQNPARQEQILKDAKCERIYLDMLSGKSMDRPQLQEMLQFMRDGDVIVVESISRLARSTKDLLTLIETMASANVRFISMKESMDTSTAQGKFMLTVFAAISELERENIRQRQAEGIAIAKKKGVYKGKPPIKIDMIEFETLYRQWCDGDITQKYMCKKLNVSESTLRRRIHEYEAKR